MRLVTVRSIPLDDDVSWLDCSHCGPVLICPHAQTRTHAADHLESHGVDASRLRE